jgi:hypothetical protein
VTIPATKVLLHAATFSAEASGASVPGRSRDPTGPPLAEYALVPFDASTL